MFCGDVALVKQERQRVTINPLRCKCWTCDDCRPMRRRGVIALAEEGKAERLITLTMAPREGCTADDDARFMAAAWTKLCRWMRPRFGGHRLQMLRIFEAHESGRPHLHVLQRGRFIPRPELMAKWEELTGSRGVDIRQVGKARNVARYVAKYVGKDLHAFEGVKRYFYTRGWVKSRAEKRAERHEAGVKFSICLDAHEVLAADWARQGYCVGWANGVPYGLAPYGGWVP